MINNDSKVIVCPCKKWHLLKQDCDAISIYLELQCRIALETPRTEIINLMININSSRTRRRRAGWLWLQESDIHLSPVTTWTRAVTL